ncbi:MAG: hypothetical protein ABI634_19415 [Acidobacteriota bacterium]
MSNALDAFRAQKEAADQVHARLAEVADLLRLIQAQAHAIGQDQALRQILMDEERWLDQARRTLKEVRAFREEEMRRFWPAIWRRWAVALVFALAAAAAFGAGYVWAAGPQEAELASLRSRVELLDAVARRVITMTPVERAQLDALMKWNLPQKR